MTDLNNWNDLVPLFEEAKLSLGTILYKTFSDFTTGKFKRGIDNIITRCKDRVEAEKKIEIKQRDKDSIKEADLSDPEQLTKRVGDIIGGRILCLTLSDIIDVADILRGNGVITEWCNDPEYYWNNNTGNWIPETQRRFANSRDSGYWGIHLHPRLSVEWSGSTYNLCTEIQIRTLSMHAWAAWDHLYVYKNPSRPTRIEIFSRIIADKCSIMDLHLRVIEILFSLRGRPRS